MGARPGDWAAALEGADALINLTGKSVDCRYTEENKAEIMASRINSTRLLGQVIAGLQSPPPLWITPHRPPSTAMPATGADGEHRRDWHGLFGGGVQGLGGGVFGAPTPRTRKAALRMAIVLGGDGGAFPVMLRLARLGLGGKMADGGQMMSWIHEDDVCGICQWLMEHPQVDGPINTSAPRPETNAETMRLIRKALKCPSACPAPGGCWRLGRCCWAPKPSLS